MYEISYYIIVGCGVAGWIYYYIVAGGVTSCSGGVVGVGVIVCFVGVILCNVGLVGLVGVVGVGIIGLCFGCILELLGYVLDAFLVLCFLILELLEFVVYPAG